MKQESNKSIPGVINLDTTSDEELARELDWGVQDYRRGDFYTVEEAFSFLGK